ncbi:glycoside hydrolase 43 family protein [Gilvimarinus sp. DA14]|uniref:glycoside hydrolase family 43 protein n=1 Tax=Gilvimarinus sp. DA14 TaxID=2956798 RepID=UPI0020B70263|nr:glycoside hydrolase 43 family protein [Gilvimarinus sp. DA14]UTF59462.1 glycoside hydrolase 43 family protein [Gilvimarinus sp. DA14]
MRTLWMLALIGMAGCQTSPESAQPSKSVADKTYQNPIIHADYSDPDVVAVNGNFYMTASSFNASPGLPVLHSKDLVHWKLINHALPTQVPADVFATPQHGNGVWAPNIRYHNNEYWIFYPDPDYGIYVTRTSEPAGQWSEPELILAGEGLIDPTPVWDDDGKAYLIHAWAKSRAGINNILTLREMAPDTSWVSPEHTTIVDANKLERFRTLEGPKFYKRNGYYYIFAPAGGVDMGWQTVFRARDIAGPYEHRIVMEQGNTLVNGPHQGSLITAPDGRDWFIHFQSKKAYGRIPHLQPVAWKDGWPIIGEDPDGDGVGQPVTGGPMPLPAVAEGFSIDPGDEFTEQSLNLVWHFNANKQQRFYSLREKPGFLRLFAQPARKGDNLWMEPALLMQKLPAEIFEARGKITLSENARDAGLLLFGEDYAWVGLRRDDQGQVRVAYVQCMDARKGCEEDETESFKVNSDTLELRVIVQPGATAVFSFRDDLTGRFRSIGEHFQAKKGRWVGAKIGFFSRANDAQAYADIDYFRLNKVGGLGE